MIVLKYIFLMIVGGGFQLSYGVDLKCKFLEDSIGYLCENSEIKNKNDDVEITGSTGRHYPGKKDTDVKMIHIFSTPLKYIPENIGSLFSLTRLHLINTELVKIKAADFVGMENLEDLDLTNNKLKSLNIETFAKLTKLESIKLNQNDLKKLENGLFSNNIKLTYINFDNNNIEFIGNTLFDNLTELNYLSFLRNTCLINLYEQDEDFKALKADIAIMCVDEEEEKFKELREEIQILKSKYDKLQKENESNKRTPITKTTMKCVYENGDIDYVCNARDLQIQRVDTIIDEILGTHLDAKEITDVKELIITKSKMFYLTKDIFKNFLELNTLTIKKVKLENLSNGDFTDATKLNNFNLMENDINELEDFIFQGAEQLMIIKMDSNKIEKISKSTFNGLKLLKTLSLKDNLIAELHVETFKDLVNLNDLILSQNKLKFLDGKLLEFNVNLEMVLIDNNQLREIGEDIFKYAKNLENVNLYVNSCIGNSSNEYELKQLIFVIKHCCKNPSDALKMYNCGDEGWE